MTNNPVVLLVDAREKPGDVDEGDERDVEGITEPDEPSCLFRGADVQGACQRRWLITHDANRVAVESAQADNDVPGP